MAVILLCCSKAHPGAEAKVKPLVPILHAMCIIHSCEVIMQVAGYGNKYLRKEGVTRITPNQIEESVNNSLQRLQTDHIDLLQVCMQMSCTS